MTITTKRLTLRPFSVRDWKTTYAYTSDPEISRYMPVLHNQTKRGTKHFLKHCEQQWKSGDVQERYDFAILLDGQHIGSVAVTRRGDGQGELGWIISRKYWGHGYATEAAKAVLDFARNTLGMKIISARCDARNTASVRIMEKLGMMLEDDTRTRRYPGSDEDVPELVYILKS